MLSRSLSFGRLNLEARQAIPSWLHGSIVLLSVLVGLGLSVLLLVASNIDVSSIFEEFVVLTFFDSAGLADVVLEWAPLILVGMSAAVAFRVNFWNIGLEGQFVWGAIGTTMIMIYDIGPDDAQIYLMCVGSIIGGAIWIVVPLVLKLRLGVSEIISTLLLNYVAGLFVLNQLFGAWQDPDAVYYKSASFADHQRLPEIGFGHVHAGLYVALGAALLVWFLIERSRLGKYMKFVGSNAGMALAAGIPVTLVLAATVLLSGALSGLGGYLVAAGQEHRLTIFVAVGYGFSGIVVAFLARNNPLAVVVVSFLMAGLYVAGENIQVFYGLPEAMIGLIQSIIVICVVGSDFFVRYRLHLVK
jgi:simple sugar transport system permease protein